MLSRRHFLKSIGGLGALGVSTTAYGFTEPVIRLGVTRYNLTPPRWPAGFQLKIAAIADLHACDPWMSIDRIHGIVERTNALNADIIVLLGDYVAGHRHVTRFIAADEWAPVLAGLKAPLGVHAVLGNHDWWEDRAVQDQRSGPTKAGTALQNAGITLHENTALRLVKDGAPVWIAGLGDQWAFYPKRWSNFAGYTGVDDLAGTLALATDDAPIILMAHEPDIFPKVPDRVALTICGHTHGGQVRLFGFAPYVPSKFGTRYIYGHIVEDGRNLIVSRGLGCSGLPVRFGAPPEIVMIELGV
jgi:predicted MPP superfamily phosphohydrolase